jgi:glycosyltransferase involved in cell wall biosynthesis
LKLHSFGKRARWDLSTVAKLCNLVRRLKPDIIHGYLEIPNCLCLVAGKLAGARVVWGIRGSDNRDFGQYDRLGTTAFSLERLASGFADLAIFNSYAGYDYYLAKGFAPRKAIVIHNGIDTDRFSFRKEGRAHLRAQLGMADSHFLIGMIARLDKKKDHPTFLRAAALLARERTDVTFACIGSGPSVYAGHLHHMAQELGLEERIWWAGAFDDMPAAYSALDIATLSSAYGEGFPNVIGEAMACGKPCVVTPAGDSARVVGDTGLVVNSRNPQELAGAWKRVLTMSKQEKERLGQKARARIVREFGKQLLVKRTEEALAELHYQNNRAGGRDQRWSR